MARKNVTFGLSEETHARLTELFPNGGLGTEENMKTLITLAFDTTATADNSQDYNSLQEDFNQLQANYNQLQDAYNQLQNNCKELQANHRLLQEENDHLRNECNDLVRENQRITMNSDRQIEFDASIMPLLEETCTRLATKYKTHVTPSDLISKMFLRYTVERLNLWFYPFVLSDSDINTLTNISARDWKKFINKK